ncbi:MAG: hypothetical protein D084_Lepto4C00688G0002 [Leptospirillum sp. Group IV 'UBA BS']|jgi:hypothetical protein|nr:MAG: hypothetical protein D084_Lepto4C00688G0002 [Leptospirillum sp. Group IV 'UBA BS']
MPGNIVDTWIEEGFQKGFQIGFQIGSQIGFQIGSQIGFQIGFQRGVQHVRTLAVRNLLAQGVLTPEQIAEIVGTEPSRVREIARSLSSS